MARFLQLLGAGEPRSGSQAMIFLFALFGAAMVWLLMNSHRPPPVLRWTLVAACALGMLWTGYLTQRTVDLVRSNRANVLADQQQRDARIELIQRQLAEDGRALGR